MRQNLVLGDRMRLMWAVEAADRAHEVVAIMELTSRTPVSNGMNRYRWRICTGWGRKRARKYFERRLK